METREPVIFGMIFLLEDDSMKAGAEDLHGGLVELLRENIRIQVVIILDEWAAFSRLSGLESVVQATKGPSQP